MKKIILLILVEIVFAINIDINNLIKKVAQNPNDVKNRLIIASYYIKNNNYKKADKYLNEILKIDPKNKYAIKLKNKIKYIKYIKYFSNLNQKENVNTTAEKLYKENKYKKLLLFYKAATNLNKNFSQKNLLNIARVAMWEGEYNLSLNILSKIKDKNSLDYIDILANNLYYQNKLNKAKKYFQILYQTTGNKEYIDKLFNIYYSLGDTNNLKQLIFSIKRHNQKLANKYEKKLKTLEEKNLITLKNLYEKEPTFENLSKYVIALYNLNKNKSFAVLKDFIKKYPNNDKAKILYAKLLSWGGNNSQALKFLSKINNINNLEAKLLIGKILTWQGEYDKAIIYLSDVYSNGNKDQKYNAKKMIAFIYLWQGKMNKAKKIFEDLIKQNPNDEEVKEELMILNNQIKPLIIKYKNLLKKQPNNENYILKLANLYYKLKSYNQAIYYFEKYLKIHPENLEIYKTLGDIYLNMKNYYKGFGYLEYYANYKNTKEAYYNLALRYYWNGYNNEALNVINDLLKKYPNYQDALILKAKILKINPRYINSNSKKNITDFFNSKSEELKALGDRAYFAELYSTAIEYYKEYLFLQPNDYDIREKYAYALEKNKNYKKAAGEFYLLMWYKKSPLIEYHYAYNLQKSGNIKKAKKIYLNLLESLPKPIPNFISNFLENWKNAWESMDFKKYEKFYSKKYKNNLYWRLHKQSIFNKASFISVGIYDPQLIYQNNNIYKIRFFQVYASKNKKDKGYKTLTLTCKNNKCQIIDEKWKAGKYIPEKNTLKKLILLNLEKIDYLPQKNNNKKLKKNSKIIKSPVLAPGLKKHLLPKKEVFTETDIKKVGLNKVKKNFLKNTPKIKKWEFLSDIEYFHDNQKTTMWIETIKLKKLFKLNSKYFILLKNYNLKVNKERKKGIYYGFGIENEKFLFDIFNDNSYKKNKIGWDFIYKQLPYGLKMKINKHNLVYSRKSICSSNHNKITFELTQYKMLSKYKDLWWSIAYESIDDGNNVITPQFDYSFYKFKKYPLTAYISGWYQFNTKTTKCYYSPKKTDTNIVGIKLKERLKYFNVTAKGGVGYSFFDKTYVYNYGIWLNKNYENIFAKIGCNISNTAPINGPANNYKSYECSANARISW